MVEAAVGWEQQEGSELLLDMSGKAGRALVSPVGSLSIPRFSTAFSGICHGRKSLFLMATGS